MQKFVIDSEHTGFRADVFIALKFPRYARSALSKLFPTGGIQVNGSIVKNGYKLKYNDQVTIDIAPLAAPPAEIVLPVLYEDDDVVVVDKPAGVISHARGLYWDEPSVASFIRSKVTNDLEGTRAGIVHRLDRATSGVIVCAKNPATLSYLQKQFNQRSVIKHYRAIVSGSLEIPQAIIDVPIERNPKRPSSFRVGHGGKAAQTTYTVLQSNSAFTELDLKPLTGRTHQLRVHLAHIGHPIVGDLLYQGAPADRMYLHAHSICIRLPNGTLTTFTSPIPAEFTALMGKSDA